MGVEEVNAVQGKHSCGSRGRCTKDGEHNSKTSIVARQDALSSPKAFLLQPPALFPQNSQGLDSPTRQTPATSAH